MKKSIDEFITLALSLEGALLFAAGFVCGYLVLVVLLFISDYLLFPHRRRRKFK